MQGEFKPGDVPSVKGDAVMIGSWVLPGVCQVRFIVDGHIEIILKRYILLRVVNYTVDCSAPRH